MHLKTDSLNVFVSTIKKFHKTKNFSKMDLINNFSLSIKEIYEIFIEMVKILDRRYRKYIWNEGQFHHSNQGIKGELVDLFYDLLRDQPNQAIKGKLVDCELVDLFYDLCRDQPNQAIKGKLVDCELVDLFYDLCRDQPNQRLKLKDAMQHESVQHNRSFYLFIKSLIKCHSFKFSYCDFYFLILKGK